MKPQPLLLVVENDATVRRFVVFIVRSDGYQVIETATAAECLEILDAEAGVGDLVITDIIMVRMDGLFVNGFNYPGVGRSRSGLPGWQYVRIGRRRERRWHAVGVGGRTQRAEIDIRRRQMAASVLLMKALGGGWDTSQLPTYRYFQWKHS